jgi:hypothetical protein
MGVTVVTGCQDWLEKIALKTLFKVCPRGRGEAMYVETFPKGKVSPSSPAKGTTEDQRASHV